MISQEDANGEPGQFIPDGLQAGLMMMRWKGGLGIWASATSRWDMRCRQLGSFSHFPCCGGASFQHNPEHQYNNDSLLRRE